MATLPFFSTKTNTSITSESTALTIEQLQEVINFWKARIEHCSEVMQKSSNDLNKKKEEKEKLESTLDTIKDEKNPNEAIKLIKLMQTGITDLENELTEQHQLWEKLNNQCKNAESILAKKITQPEKNPLTEEKIAKPAAPSNAR